MNAFCRDSDAYLKGAPDGPLAGLTFAAKDIFDVVGHITGAGNPDWKATHAAADRSAWVVDRLVKSGATMVGKTITDELTRGIFGENPHYGTPVNPRAPGRVPGGSSSGSASAVAGGLVDFSLGSDTGGSVRVPAAFCGLYGIRPTHGRVRVDGMVPQAPSYDTVGWFARDADTLARVVKVLISPPASTAKPRLLLVAEDAFEVADPASATALRPIVDIAASLIGASSKIRISPTGLAEWSRHQRVLQGREAWETARAWIDRVNPRLAFSVSESYMAGRSFTDAQVEEAVKVRADAVAIVDELLADGAVLCLPTAPTPAPTVGEPQSVRRPLGARIGALTCIAGIMGCPQINLPLADVNGLPVGLSLIAARGSDESLIALARQIEAAIA
jgi:amidase